MRAVLAVVLPVVPALLLTGCSAAAPSASPSPAPERRPVVDSALCDDLREVVRVRQGTPELAGVDERAAATAAVEAASRRVLVQLGATPVVPEDVVQALRELEGGAGPDDGLDATVAAYVEKECG